MQTKFRAVDIAVGRFVLVGFYSSVIEKYIQDSYEPTREYKTL